MAKWRSMAGALAGCVILIVLATAAVAEAADPVTGTGDVWNKLSGPLLQLLAVVIVLESALAALFQWRPWRMAFNGKAFKTPVMLVVGGLLVWAMGYDPMAKILAADGIGLVDPLKPTFWQAVLTGVLSAMIVAGGSSGINALLARLGLRAVPVTDEEKAARELTKDQAWVSVRAIGAVASDPIQIGVEELADQDTSATKYHYDLVALPPLAGTIDPRSAFKKAWASFFADNDRFPSYGGRRVAAGPHCRITATWKGRDGWQTVGVFRGRFASRAVIDLVVDLSKDLP